MKFLAAFGLGVLVLTRAASAGEPLRPTRYELDVALDLKEERMTASARVTIRNAGPSAAGEASFLLYRLLTVSAVRSAAGSPLAFSQSVVAFEDDPKRQANRVRVLLAPPLEPGGEATVEIAYAGYLAGYVETGALYIQDSIGDAFTIVREDADAYPTLRPPSWEKIRSEPLPEFDYLARVTVPDSHVVANGGLLVERTAREGRATYVYRNRKPAWRMDFAVARYRELDAPGLSLFALPDDAAGAERVQRSAAACLALYRGWFGALPDATTYTIIEIPDGWGSQADVTSILQAAAAFRDPEKIHELYHEISHLWNVPSKDAAYCRWNEGLAGFLEALTQETLDGTPSLDAQAEKTARRQLERAREDPRLATVPMIDYGRAGMTGDSYRTGMLMFFALYRLVGPATFRSIIGAHTARHHSGGATTAEFVAEAERAGGPGVAPLFRDWLFTTRWLEILSSGAEVRTLAERYRKTVASQ
ncbi:MAG TPA: hypothetical protein VFA98_11980 [Thermoanaerobaculia bacterium]|nr:hypothetical protein [Thermoanaerobaculia bacterium]